MATKVKPQAAVKDNKFKKAYFSLKHADLEEVKLRIISECNITDDVFQNWVLGRTEIPVLAKPIVDKIIFEYKKRYHKELSKEIST